MTTDSEPRGPNGASGEGGVPEAGSAAPVTVDEAVELYPNEWMLMQVTESEDGLPRRGFIVAHAKRRGAIQARVIKAVTSAKETGKKYYLFFGFRQLRSAEEWKEALDREVQRLRRRR